MWDMELSDHEAVAASLNDREMFRVLVQKYQPLLGRYIARLGADPEAVKDIVQETFIKTYINLNDFDSSRSFNSWIYRIAHNQAMNHFRKQRNRPQVTEIPEDARALETIADELNIEHEIDVRMQGKEIRDALQQIHPRYFEVLSLRFFEEKSYDEIADILRLPAGTVSTYLTRGKAELRSKLLVHADNGHIL